MTAFPPCYRAAVPAMPSISPIARRGAAWLAGLYLDLAIRSTRWQLEGKSNLRPFLAGGAVIVAIWHERLPLAPAFWAKSRRDHPTRRVAALASRHRDGQLIAAILGNFGVRAIHGSSGRSKPGQRRDHGGAAGLRGLIAALTAGDAVVITPDGPRGPRRVAAPGVALLASLAQAPVLALGAEARWRVTLRSWDRMSIPLPFGRGVLICLPPIPPELATLPTIEAALTQAADRAHQLCAA